LDIRLAADLYIDGVRTHNGFLKAGRQRQVLGIRKTVSSVLPFKFQELELVGAFPQFLGQHVACFPHLLIANEDPDVENAPVDDVVVPEMGTIEIRTFRCRTVRTAQYHNRGHRLHQGRVSKRSNKAGWHHVRYVLGLKATRPNSSSHPRVILIYTPSTADEIPTSRYKYATDLLTYLDPRDAPYASVKVFYRPRGGSFYTLSYNLANALPELLVDQGVIAGHDVGAGNGNPGGSEVNDRKRAREGGSPGPSKRAKEEMSALSQQIQALQVSGAN
jgi:hypothetical protein